jgi:hypothetical protein
VVRDTLHAKPRDNSLEIATRSRDAGFRNGSLDEIQVWRQALTGAEVATLHGLAPATWPTDLAREHARLRADPTYAAAWAALQKARRELAAHQETAPAFFAMEHSPLAPPTYVLTRGDYDKPEKDKLCPPGAPASVFPWDAKLNRDRLGLARWLTDPRHPLTSRVIVNRLWAQVFGSGLVASTENFGLQGDDPTHPELLDTLAVEFVQGGWNTKAMLRRLVLSATFRQASTPTAAAREKDPANRWLARGPVLRLTSEMVRDQALLAAGTLVEKIGGESASEGARRRSVYTYRRRTAPPDSMLIFDAGSREVCQPRRLNTNTPLQALVLLNNPVFAESAQKLAAKVAPTAAAPRDQIALAFRAVCTREARPTELAALEELHAAQKALVAAEPPPAPVTDAKGKKTTPRRPDPAMVALTRVCATILASDAAVTSR